jgi:hypothetical protein
VSVGFAQELVAAEADGKQRGRHFRAAKNFVQTYFSTGVGDVRYFALVGKHCFATYFWLWRKPGPMRGAIPGYGAKLFFPE